jgi:hypothetical protein
VLLSHQLVRERECLLGSSVNCIHPVKAAGSQGLERLQQSGRELGGGDLPVPGQQLFEPVDVVIIDPCEHVGEPGLRVD